MRCGPTACAWFRDRTAGRRYGVNSGIGRAVKVLQRLVGVEADARMTDASLALLARRAAADLIGRLCDERLAFLKQLKTWPVFGAGWSRRVGEVPYRSAGDGKGRRERQGQRRRWARAKWNRRGRRCGWRRDCTLGASERRPPFRDRRHLARRRGARGERLVDLEAA